MLADLAAPRARGTCGCTRATKRESRPTLHATKVDDHHLGGDQVVEVRDEP